MTTLEERRAEAALARRTTIEAREGGNRGDRPAMRRAVEDPDGPRRGVRIDLGAVEVRAKAKGDADETHIVGMASVTERGYDMWDEFGPYVEVVALSAFDTTLASDPAVEFTLNHNRNGGAPMAATWNQTLQLEAIKEGDVTGLGFDANVDSTRNDVGDLVKAFQRGDQRDASFKFGIDRGVWSPDFTQYRIEQVDLNGGDVTSANFGASPFASSGLRAAPPKSGLSVVRDGYEVARVL